MTARHPAALRRPSRHLAVMLLAVWTCALLAACAGTIANRIPRDKDAVTERGGMAREGSDPAADKRVAALFDRAVTNMEKGRDDRALRDLQRLVELAPDLSAPHNNLGILYKREGKLDPAIEHYRRAIELKPDYAEAHNNLGIAYREKGLFEMAEKAYEHAIRIDSNLAAAHFNLGVLYDIYLDRPAEAIRQYRRFLDLDEQNKQEVELWISGLERRLTREEAGP